MSDLRDLYQELILDHTKHPRNFGKVEGATSQADGHNPLCGDRVRVFLRIENDVVTGISFEGSGCAISTASASMMTEGLKGKNIAEVRKLFHQFHELLTNDSGRLPDLDALGKLAVFSGVKEFPVRVKCATLAWHTMNAALDHQEQQVSTE
jgi:nitrogen fixation NifU-like protein